jgi:hypothetical protein
MKIQGLKIWHFDSLLLWAFVFTAITKSVCLPASFFKEFYFNVFYKLLRYGYDYTLGLLFFGSFYILLPIVLYMFFRFFRGLKGKSPGQITLYSLLNISRVLAMIYVLFYWLWAFNYELKLLQVPKAEKGQFSSIFIHNEAMDVMRIMAELRFLINTDSTELSPHFAPKNIEDSVRKSLTEVLAAQGVSAFGKPRVRALYPKGLLLRLATLGVYIPFTMEAHYDPGLAKLHQPFVMAHEMSHGYGITDEGECNFLAILACIQSEDRYIQYSGWMAYWRYLMNGLYRNDKVLFELALDDRNPLVKYDHEHILERLNKYPEILSDLRNKVYDKYLKSHGVSDGLQSYGTVVEMMLYHRHRDYVPVIEFKDKEFEGSKDGQLGTSR